MELKFDRLIQEITDEDLSFLNNYERVEPFDNIFGNNKRIAVPFESGTELINKLERVLKYDNLVLDAGELLVYTEKNFEKRKNPTKIGKALTMIKNKLEKQLARINDIVGSFKELKKRADEISTSSIKKETPENKNFLDEMYEELKEIKDDLRKELSAYLGMSESDVDINDVWIWKDIRSELFNQNSVVTMKLKSVEELLKIHDIRKQLDDSRVSSYIIYSRSPIDILRMSDHSTISSCHSVGRSEYHHAQCEAVYGGGIAYLITKQDFDEFIGESKSKLQDDEIFSDHERDVDGITPTSRIRIRLLEDSNGKQIPVPAAKIYGASRTNAFAREVQKWCMENTPNDVDWEGTFKLRGGSYEEYDVDSYMRKAWGKIINFEYPDIMEDGRIQEIYTRVRDLGGDAITRSLLGKRELADFPFDDLFVGIDIHPESPTSISIVFEVSPENPILDQLDASGVPIKMSLERYEYPEPLETKNVPKISLHSQTINREINLIYGIEINDIYPEDYVIEDDIVTNEYYEDIAESIIQKMIDEFKIFTESYALEEFSETNVLYSMFMYAYKLYLDSKKIKLNTTKDYITFDTILDVGEALSNLPYYASNELISLHKKEYASLSAPKVDEDGILELGDADKKRISKTIDETFEILKDSYGEAVANYLYKNKESKLTYPEIYENENLVNYYTWEPMQIHIETNRHIDIPLIEFTIYESNIKHFVTNEIGYENMQSGLKLLKDMEKSKSSGKTLIEIIKERNHKFL